MNGYPISTLRKGLAALLLLSAFPVDCLAQTYLGTGRSIADRTIALSVMTSPTLVGMGETATILATITNQNALSNQQLQPGDQFVLDYDLGDGTFLSTLPVIIVTSATLSPLNFAAAWGADPQQVAITYNGPAAVFGVEDAIAVRVSVQASSYARTNRIYLSAPNNTRRFSIAQNGMDSWASADFAFGVPGPAGPQGPAGVPGANGPAGPAGVAGVAGAPGATGPPVAFKGAWNSASAYVTGDAVFYNGSAYIAIANSVALLPDGNPSFWSVLAQQGGMGPIGPAGPAGPAGASGPAGPTGLAGPAGATGPQGPQGVAGAPGPQGSTGPTGPPGRRGHRSLLRVLGKDPLPMRREIRFSMQIRVTLP